MSTQHGDVSIVIPNYDGLEHLGTCLESIAELDAPGDVEVVIVDNGSVDGSIEYLRRAHPEVTLIEHGVNTGFARAANHGAEVARHPLVAFLNNDMRVDRSWLRNLIEPLLEGRCEVTTSQARSWDGQRIDFAGGASNFHGIGFELGHGESVESWDVGDEQPSLFAMGGAMAIRKELFLEVGGFDESFFAYYEDVDLGWRLWVLGHRIHFVPSSLVFHHHSATAMRVEESRRRVFYIRNPLCSIFKNYDDANLKRVLPAALLLTTRRTYYQSRLREEPFRFVGPKPPKASWRQRLAEWLLRKEGRTSIGPVAAADIVALNDFTRALPRLNEERAKIQGARQRPDSEILPLFRKPFCPIEPNAEYAELQAVIVEQFGLTELFPGGGD
ncbi:MAG: glycosyltransferase family 2 protein [Planctomycetota bacterium]